MNEEDLTLLKQLQEENKKLKLELNTYKSANALLKKTLDRVRRNG